MDKEYRLRKTLEDYKQERQEDIFRKALAEGAELLVKLRRGNMLTQERELIKNEEV